MDKTDRNRNIGFDRYLSPLDVWAIAFGCIVGWGAFVMPGTTFLPMAGPLGTAIAMIISIILMLVIGANYSFLMTHNPKTGGVYSYTKAAFGRDHAFLCAWFLSLSYLTVVFLNATALFIVIRAVFNDVLQTGYHYRIAEHEVYLKEVVLSVFALLAVGLLFIKAKPILQKIQSVLAILLLAGTLIVSAVCIPRAVSADVYLSFGSGQTAPGFGILMIVLLSPWAFVGFDASCLETVHFRFPVRHSKWIISLSIILSGLVYTGLTFLGIAAVPDGFASWQEYISSLGDITGVTSVPTFYSAQAIMGKAGLIIMVIAALSAILTGMIAAYRASTRVLSTMAEDHILSEKFNATTVSILFIMGISIVISFLGRNALDWFVELTTFGALVGFGYTSASACRTAKMENNKLIMCTGAFGAGLTLVFGLIQLIPGIVPMETMGGASFLLLALWCLLGFVFYWRTINYSTLSVFSGISVSGIVLFALLVYCAIIWFVKRIISVESTEEMRMLARPDSMLLLLIIFVGLVVMLYIQNLLRKKHEELEREKIHAVESNLAKSRFLFNMSHDIRTPMNAIVGYTNLAKEETDSPKMQEYLSRIETSSQQLLNLINDILEMSRIESGRLELVYEPADICSIMEDARNLFEEQMKEKKLRFTVDASRIKNRYVWCDRKNLDRVLLNLVSNAYKFTPAEGTVAVSLTELEEKLDEHGSYELRVRDTGIGMSSEFMDKMFTAFERERTSTVSGIQGTGLGLAITKNILDLMGGTIEVLTAPGNGTEFIIRLKFRLAGEEDIRRLRHDEETDEGLDFTGRRVLLAEDNDINREIAVMILQQQGFAVETAANGQEALAKVRNSEPGYYDMVLMDIQMPVMDGYEATAAIRSLNNPELSRIPIVAMTANAFREDEEAAEKAGMQAHIAKPLNIDTMKQKLAEVLAATEQRDARKDK